MEWTKQIEALEERAGELEGYAQKAREAAALLRQIGSGLSGGAAGIKADSGPQHKRKAPRQDEPRKRRTGAATKTPAVQERSSRRGASGTPFSQYKGVTKGKPRKDGTLTYKAGAYSAIDKKIHFLGTYEVEELAAAAVQEFLGNKTEAKRLRAIGEQKWADSAEQRENNPNKPRVDVSSHRHGQHQYPKRQDQAPVENEDSQVGVVWRCDDCGHQHISTLCPKHCESCGHSALSRFC